MPRFPSICGWTGDKLAVSGAFNRMIGVAINGSGMGLTREGARPKPSSLAASATAHRFIPPEDRHPSASISSFSVSANSVAV